MIAFFVYNAYVYVIVHDRRRRVQSFDDRRRGGPANGGRVQRIHVQLIISPFDVRTKIVMKRVSHSSADDILFIVDACNALVRIVLKRVPKQIESLETFCTTRTLYEPYE